MLNKGEEVETVIPLCTLDEFRNPGGVMPEEHSIQYGVFKGLLSFLKDKIAFLLQS